MEINACFRYYFQHPWSRLIVAYLVTFFNFLIFAEDPVSHSQTEAHIIVVGNCFSFLFNKYPGLGWNILKVICWILAIITGLFAGKFIFHRQLFGKSCTQWCGGMCRIRALLREAAFWVSFVVCSSVNSLFYTYTTFYEQRCDWRDYLHNRLSVLPPSSFLVNLLFTLLLTYNQTRVRVSASLSLFSALCSAATNWWIYWK